MARSIRVEGDVAYVPLTRGYTAVIDAVDVSRVAEWSWASYVDRCASGEIRNVYACRSVSDGKKHTILMHRWLVEAAENVDVDHEDSNGLNNRRHNLRQASRAQNMHNSRGHRDSMSGVKGVSWNKNRAKWHSQIMVNGQKFHLGYFVRLEDAAAAYASASAKHHGEFGRTA